MCRFLRLLIHSWLLGSIAAGLGAAEVELEPPVPWVWEVSSGVLRSVGRNASPLDYVMFPQMLSVKPPPTSRWVWDHGTVTLRPRLSVLLEPIVRGPETYYLGLAAAGELEWRPARGRIAYFFASGGGLGWMDSRGYEVEGGQGQDFNLNWLIHSGVRYRTRTGWQWAAGLYFQHISNRGMDAINPGMDVLGPMVGLSREF